MKVLFILHKRKTPWSYCESYSTGSCFSSGLSNSAGFVNQMLLDAGIDSKLVQVVDGNGIDREVHQFRPDVVILEAFFVTPKKLEEVRRLHPGVMWIVRNHSEIPFLSTEGIGMDWSLEYVKLHRVYIAPNSLKTYNDFRFLARNFKHKVLYLPNFYPIKPKLQCVGHKNKDHVDISCFGAIRPLKNPLLQAVAALKFAKVIGKRLVYHINSKRVENSGESTLKSIRTLFAHQNPKHVKLVEHDWHSHADFMKLCRRMDIGLQVSFTESFNICASDATAAGVPIVGSKEIPWLTEQSVADCTDSNDILRAMLSIWHTKSWNVFKNQLSIYWYSKKARHIWLKTLASL